MQPRCMYQQLGCYSSLLSHSTMLIRQDPFGTPVRAAFTIHPTMTDGDIEDILCEKGSHEFTEEEVETIRTSLLVWFDSNRRRLPWRGDSPPFVRVPDEEEERENSEPVKRQMQRVSPYATWVSEVMLQQTRVETVCDYFLKWMSRFPTISDLAAAEPEDVNLMWNGLGYYRRARFLHSGAKYVMESCGGRLPQEKAQLLKIPGIGEYTAGAIASIAFGKRFSVVDGNVIRVLSRLRRLALSPKDKRLVSFCWSLSEHLVDGLRPGDFNQAMMELGATLCTPKKPKCEVCPLQSQCQAFQESSSLFDKKKLGKRCVEASTVLSKCSFCGESRRFDGADVTIYPLKAEKPIKVNSEWAVFILEAADTEVKYLLRTRPEEGLLAGQLEFPMSEIPKDSTRCDRMAKTDSLIQLYFNAPVDTLSVSRRIDLGAVTHIFTHRLHTYHVELISLPKVGAAEVFRADMLAKFRLRWMTSTELTNSLTTGMKKVLELVSRVDDSNSRKRKPSKEDSSSAKRGKRNKSTQEEF